MGKKEIILGKIKKLKDNRVYGSIAFVVIIILSLIIGLAGGGALFFIVLIIFIIFAVGYEVRTNKRLDDLNDKLDDL